jgi:hypothetical protein
MRRPLFLLSLTVVSLCLPASAQDGFISYWLTAVSKTQAQQPHWVTPVVTVTPRLEQEFRYDFLRQRTAAGDTLVNIGNAKGLELVPFSRVELIFNLPPYLAHNNPAIHDGLGDTTFLLKYRLFSANEQNGNYIVTAFLGASVPTGTYKNGAASATVTPTIAAGKGDGKFSIQSTLGVSLPTDDTERIGRSVLFNTAFQYHLTRHLWPEAEVNSTFFHGGTQDGNKQAFITPGLVVGRFPIHNRIALTLAAGMQFATTHFHTSDHNLIFSVRIPF